MTNKDIVRKIVLKEIERMELGVQSFEDNPIEFLLQKYPTMKQTLEMLMSSAYKDYITGIYIVAPKPTTFKIVLHNDQDFFLTYMGKAYEANVSGKKFYLQTIGEKERCMEAISRLLTLGNPIHNKGPEDGEESADAEPTSEEAGATEAAGATEEAEETES
jgi:hypothetical protein